MDQELIAYLDARFRESARQVENFREETLRRFEQIDGRFERIDGRFERIEGRLEHADTRFEQLESTVRHTQVMVEGLRSEIQMLGEGVMGIDERLLAFRAEVAKEFEATRALINPPYLDLNTRVQSLESWRERTERDPMDLIRERFGKKP